MLWRIILTVLLAGSISCSSRPIQSESYTIIASNRSAGYSNTAYNNTYIQSFNTVPYVIVSLINLITPPSIVNWGINFQLVYPQTATSFRNQFTLVQPSTVVSLARLRYLAVDHDDYPNYLCRYYYGQFSALKGGLAQGSGSRSESYDLSIVGGLFNLSQPISIIGYLAGFQGTFNSASFSLESSVKVLNQTHFRMTFSTDDNNIYLNASAYIIAYINNLTTYADVGHLYGYRQNQVNIVQNISDPTMFFIGLNRVVANGSNVTVVLNSDDMSISTTSNYWNLTYSYMYFRTDVLCNGDPCVCFDGYQMVGAVCHEVCQDGRTYELACDDGNNVNGDGCSDTCSIEPYYYCYNTGGRSPSTCNFVGPLQLAYKEAIKFAAENKANVTFTVVPAFADMADIPWQSILTSNNSFSIQSASYSNGVLSVVGSYSGNLTDTTTKIFVKAPLDGTYHYIWPSSVSFRATDSSGFPPYAYTADEYQFGQVFMYAAFLIEGLYWLAFLFALYCSKMIGVEMMSVLQMSFLAVATLDHRSAVLESLPYLKYSLGFNILLQDGASSAPTRILKMGYYGRFLTDYNLTVITLVGCLLAGLIFYIYHIVKVRKEPHEEYNKNKRVEVLIHIFTDCLIAIALFNVYGIVFAFTVNVMYQSPLSIPDVAFGGVMMLMLIGIAVYYCRKVVNFRQCLLFFINSKQNTLPRYHPLFMMADRLVFSLLAATIGQYSYSTYALIAWTLAYTLFVALKNPYEHRGDSIRSLATQSAALTVFFLYCVMRNASNLSGAAYIYIPAAVLVVLLANMVGNLAFVIKEFRIRLAEFRQNRKNKANLEKMLEVIKKQQEIEMARRQEAQTVQQVLHKSQKRLEDYIVLEEN